MKGGTKKKDLLNTERIMFFLLFIDESLCKCTFETLLRLLLKKICIINLFVCPVFELDYLVHRYSLQTSPAALGDTARSKVKVNVGCVALQNVSSRMHGRVDPHPNVQLAVNL